MSHFSHVIYQSNIRFNSYIRDSQVYGDCTPETYIHALRTGCRAVESKLSYETAVF